MLKLLVIEDHPIVVGGCRALFADDPNILMIDARSAEAGRTLYASEGPNVVIVDINLPDGSGLDVTREFIQQDPAANILVFSMSDAPVVAVQAIDLGAKGYVSKNGDPDDLRDAVLALSRGETWLPDNLIQEMAILRASSGSGAPPLCNREIQILRLIVHGRSLAEIAADLDISYKTAAARTATIRNKLNARTTSEMVRIAIELRLT